MSKWIVSLYAKGDRRVGDCIPEFFSSRAEAEWAGENWLMMAYFARQNGDDKINGWAVRYTIRRDDTKWPNTEDSPT